MTSAIRLEIPLQKKITSYLNIAYPMLFILSEPKLENWFYERFVHIYSQQWYGYYLRTDYADSSRYFGDLLERHAHSIEETRAIVQRQSIISFLRSAITEGYAVNVFTLDKYYLPETEEYHREHLVHELLVTGFDDRTEKFDLIGYKRNGQFGEFTTGYASFEQAFERGLADAPEVLKESLQLMKRRPLRREYRFDPGSFVRELEKLVYSLPDHGKLYFSLADESEAAFGFQVKEGILEQMRRKVNGERADLVNYTAFHFIAEHSELLMDRLLFVRNYVKPDGKLSAMMESYATVHNDYKKLRLLFLRHAMSETGFNSRFNIRDKQAFSSLHQMLERIVSEEKALLIDIHAGLNRICKP
ncbi:hypothetical protein [Paenibacillus sp. NPDC058071]|uniref:hypothetical protein n=1 Tax=Paenibacillus sp. NPDC058071 TaxID=3346326 RepID=UPI0036DDFDDC